jgi:hypothetical protein
MATVVVTVDCIAANTGKCYTRELVRVAEEFIVPFTWLIYVSQKDPMSNVNLYHAEYFHRIPSWHEYGLLLSFENSQGYIADPSERGDLIRIGKDVLKQCHIKATASRAHRYDLLPTDLKHLEDIEILVDSSACPGARDKYGVVRPEGPTQPYHPSYTSLNDIGNAKILIAPIATHGGVPADLDLGWERVRPVLEHCLCAQEVTIITLSDNMDNAATLQEVLALCKEKGARFTHLTQLAAISS